MVNLEKTVSIADLKSKDVHLLKNGTYSAAKNMALDEAMMSVSEDTGRFFIRFYNFRMPTIIYASHDHADNLRMENLEGIDVTRRDSGGNIIYLDDRTLTYSISGGFREDSKKIMNGMTDKIKIHERFGGVIVDAIRSMVQNPELVESGIHHSITIDGKPVAGHAQRIRTRSFLYQGVLAVGSWDADKIRSLIRIDDEKYDELKRLPSLADAAGGNAEACRRLFIDRVMRGFSHEGIVLKANEQDLVEIERISETLVKKYEDRSFVYNRDDRLDKEPKFCLLYYPTS